MNSLMVRQNLTPDTWKMIAEIAPTMAQSRLFGVPSPEAAAAIMLKGYELGLSLTASFEFIHLIDGKPGLSPRGALALIQNSPEFGSMEIQDITDKDDKPERCRVTMTRKNGYSYTAEFTMQDAIKADLVKPKSGWEKYPANMLRWRCVGYCADVVYPDVIGGMKRVDELGAEITTQGDFLQAPTSGLIIENGQSYQSGPKVATVASEAIPSYGIDLPQLMSLSSNEDILAANNGSFPMPNQVNEVVHRLVMSGKLVLENEPTN